VLNSNDHPVEELWEKNYWGLYRAEVVAVDDPKKTGRVRVRVHPMMAGVRDEHLPWAVPVYPLGDNRHDPPEVGTKFFCYFEAGDIFQPVICFQSPHMKADKPSTPQAAYEEPDYYKTLNQELLTASSGGQSFDEKKIEYSDDYPRVKVSQRGDIVTEVNEAQGFSLDIVGQRWYTRVDKNGDIVTKRKNIFLYIVENLYIKVKKIFIDAEETVFGAGTEELVTKAQMQRFLNLFKDHIHLAQGMTSKPMLGAVPVDPEVMDIETKMPVKKIKVE